MFVFWLIVVVALILLWFLLSFSFKPIGYIFKKLFDDAVEEIYDEDKQM